MPETNEGKLQLMKIQTQLEDHIAQQAGDMNEIKGGINRIETKLDAKVSKDEVDRLALEVKTKASQDQLDKLDAKFWAVVMAIVVAFISIIVTAIKTFNGKL